MATDAFRHYWDAEIDDGTILDNLRLIRDAINHADTGLEAETDEQNIELILHKTPDTTKDSYKKALEISDSIFHVLLPKHIPKLILGQHGMVYEEPPVPSIDLLD